MPVVTYLQGNQVPMVENVDLPSDKLGDGWRCVFDFGVALIEKKAAVLSTDTA